jgi:hypothetical protein
MLNEGKAALAHADEAMVCSFSPGGSLRARCA